MPTKLNLYMKDDSPVPVIYPYIFSDEKHIGLKITTKAELVFYLKLLHHTYKNIVLEDIAATRLIRNETNRRSLMYAWGCYRRLSNKAIAEYLEVFDENTMYAEVW